MSPGVDLRHLSRRPPIERFMGAIIVAENGCWEWQCSKWSTGYGKFTVNKKAKLTHRFAWEHFRGPIPEGLVIDHLCRNICCCNPDHLEPVTTRENVRRGLATREAFVGPPHPQKLCKRGHLLPLPVIMGDGRIAPRQCHICADDVHFAWRVARRAKIVAARVNKVIDELGDNLADRSEAAAIADYRWGRRRNRTECPRGHEYSGDNLFVDNRGSKGCRTCRRDAARKFRGSSATGAPRGAKAHCPKGHPYAGENLVIGAKGEKKCRECRRLSVAAANLKRRSPNACQGNVGVVFSGPVNHQQPPFSCPNNGEEGKTSAGKKFQIFGTA